MYEKSKIEILSNKDILKSVIEHWIASYGEQPLEYNHAEILRNLKECDGTKKSIDRIIGNDSWTRCVCRICKKENIKIAIISDEFQFFEICLKCAKSLVKLLKNK